MDQDRKRPAVTGPNGFRRENGEEGVGAVLKEALKEAEIHATKHSEQRETFV